MNYFLLGFSVVIFTTFVALLWRKYGILNSISAGFYKLPEKQRWIFTLALWGFSIPIIVFGGLNNAELLFLAGGAIVWTGAAAAYNSSDLELKIHITSAMAGVIVGLAHLVINLHLYYLVGGATVIAFIIYKRSKNYTWWLEILYFYTIIIGLLWKL